MFGIDISNYQKGIDLSKYDTDFVIMKATEGNGFEDKSFKNYLVQLTKLDKLIGCYHFARPDLHPTLEGMMNEAVWFVNTMKDYDLLGKAILVLDWEVEPMNQEALIREWLENVQNMTGVKPFIYGSRSKLTTTAFKNLLSDYPIWMAAWPTTRSVFWDEVEEYVNKYMAKKNNVNWIIWQFSANGKLSGFNGAVDLDYAEMSRNKWLEMAGSVSTPEPEAEIISADMQWAIDIGLFQGYGDGRYGPKDYLTREQAAVLFRRYNKIIESNFQRKYYCENTSDVKV